MVSVYANPPPGQDFYGYYPMVMRTGLPGLDSLQPAAANGKFTTGSVNSGMEDTNKKVRKPYTVTKSRESWTELEHDKFLEALQLFDRDWKKIKAFVGSKTVIQIRSHAQKYFLKVQKSGANEHLPPPRPKRKASHPYPQKSPKKAVSQGTVPFQSSVALAEPGHVIWSDSFSVPESSINPSWSAWTYDNVPVVSMAHVTKENMVLAGASATMTQNRSSSSNEIAPSIWPNNEAKDQGKERQDKPMRAMPDFAQVYSFIGSVFDPNASDHLQRLRKMDPINVETVLMLIKNLSANLISPEFEDHRRLLSSQSAGTDKDKTDASSKNIQAIKSGIAVPSV